MYCDLYLPFPTSSPGAGPSTSTSTKKGKGKAAAAPVLQTVNRTCWDDLPQKEKEDADKTFAISGHRKPIVQKHSNVTSYSIYPDRLCSGIYPRSEFDTLDAKHCSTAEPICK